MGEGGPQAGRVSGRGAKPADLSARAAMGPAVGHPEIEWPPLIHHGQTATHTQHPAPSQDRFTANDKQAAQAAHTTCTLYPVASDDSCWSLSVSIHMRCCTSCFLLLRPASPWWRACVRVLAACRSIDVISPSFSPLAHLTLTSRHLGLRRGTLNVRHDQSHPHSLPVGHQATSGHIRPSSPHPRTLNLPHSHIKQPLAPSTDSRNAEMRATACCQTWAPTGPK